MVYTYGAIAQLGERLICIQEVGGSIPPGSTIYVELGGLPVSNDPICRTPALCAGAKCHGGVQRMIFKNMVVLSRAS